MLTINSSACLTSALAPTARAATSRSPENETFMVEKRKGREGAGSGRTEVKWSDLLSRGKGERESGDGGGGGGIYTERRRREEGRCIGATTMAFRSTGLDTT